MTAWLQKKNEETGEFKKRSASKPKRYDSDSDTESLSSDEGEPVRKVPKLVRQKTMNSVKEILVKKKSDENTNVVINGKKVTCSSDQNYIEPSSTIKLRLKKITDQLVSFTEQLPGLVKELREIVTGDDVASDSDSVMPSLGLEVCSGPAAVSVSSSSSTTVRTSLSSSSSSTSTSSPNSSIVQHSCDMLISSGSDNDYDSPFVKPKGSDNDSPFVKPKNLSIQSVFGLKVDSEGYVRVFGVRYPAEHLLFVKTSSLRATVYGLAKIVFSKIEMTTCSVRGIKSNAHKVPAKPALPSKKLAALIMLAQQVHCNATELEIMRELSKKLNIECKMKTSKSSASAQPDEPPCLSREDLTSSSLNSQSGK